MPDEQPSSAAQDAYKSLLKVYIAPRLRDLGFKGSGRNYKMTIPAGLLGLNFQASMYSSRDGVKFTINVSVQVLDGEGQRVVTRPPGVYEHPWMEGSTRIGHLLPADGDFWWTLRPTDSVEALGSEVVAAIRVHAIPAMRARHAVLAQDAPTLGSGAPPPGTAKKAGYF